MSRPDPIEYAERLYGAIRAANFSPISFLAFGNAVKEGVAMRSMPRIAVEPFMRVVGEMLDLEEAVADDGLPDAEILQSAEPSSSATVAITHVGVQEDRTPVSNPAEPIDPKNEQR